MVRETFRMWSWILEPGIITCSIGERQRGLHSWIPHGVFRGRHFANRSGVLPLRHSPMAKPTPAAI